MRSPLRFTTRLYFVFALLAAFGGAGCSSCKREREGGGERKDGKLTPGARIPTPIRNAAYVTNNGSDSISVLDRDGTTVTTVPVDLDPDAHEAPHHLALDPTANAVFVALAFPEIANQKARSPHAAHGGAANVGKLARLDLETLAMTKAVPVDENPGDVVLTHDRKRVLVTHFDMKRAMDVAARGAASPASMFAHLVVLDASTLARVASRAVCTAPHGIVTTRDDRTAFIACYGSDELAVVDLATDGLPTSRTPLGSAPGVPGVPRYGPYSAVLSPDEKLVVIGDLEGQDVRVFDRASGRFDTERTVHLAAKAFMPAFVDPTTLLVPTQAPDGLVRVDLESKVVTGRASLNRAECTLPHVVSVARDGRIYLVCEGNHTQPGSVLEIDRETLATKKRWNVGVYADGIAFGE
jgi:DNA-binding beta-propeller fold protein YncE